MIEVANPESVGRVDIETQKPERKNNIPDLIFCIGVMAVQLHKYSSFIYKEINLNIRSSNNGLAINKFFNLSISGDQTFDSLLQIFNESIGLSFLSFPRENKKIVVYVDWFSPEDQQESLLHAQIDCKSNFDFANIQFNPVHKSIFHEITRKSAVHFKKIVGEVKADPQILLKDIVCFTEEDQVKIHEIAYGEQINSIPQRLHELFEQMVEQRPNHPAVSFNGKTWSYEDINVESNYLAHVLEKRGTKSGDFVGILLNRSVDAYIAILGILKSGAAYVPIDPDLPHDRIHFILKDSSCKLLISTTDFISKHIDYPGNIILMNNGLPNISEQNSRHARYDKNFPGPFSSRTPAYVIYTSGSTGTPKGVVVSHGSVVNLVLAEREIFKLKSDDKVLQGFSLAFDASIEEIWLAFASGAMLVPASKSLMYSGEDLADFINQEKITVLSTVPTLLSSMKPHLPSLRVLILGGEPCSHELLQRWYRTDLRIVNTYGPTESTVIATYDEFDPDCELTIGKPIQNCAAFIMSEYLQPLPPGIPGELCLAGSGLANGYLNRHELTQSKFVSSNLNLSSGYGKRLYRSGDLAMFTQEGKIKFMGRIDSQVKLRGYRIELSEIEAQLLHFDNIENCCAAVKTDSTGMERLVAYLILKDPSREFDEKACKEFLAQRLAQYMVPGIFIEVQSFPTLTSGKIDRKKLPELESCNVAPRKIIEGRNQTEKIILAIWMKLFAPHPVSMDDNFFLDLGGHSLLAARMISELRLHDNFKHVSIVDVYKNPTIERLAKAIGIQSNADENSDSEEEDREPAPKYSAPAKLKHMVCGAFQFISLYFVFSLHTALAIAGYLVYFYQINHGYSWIQSTMWALVSTVAGYPIVIAIAIMLKWILLGRIKPGQYKLWGWFYFRWWLVQNLIQVVGFDHFAGTPLLPILYRLLGVRIGKNVHLDTDHLSAFDLISIGEGSSVDEDVKLNGHSVRDGYLNIQPIEIGKRCFIGERSVLREGSSMANDSRLETLSLLLAGSKIDSGETWKGSPAQYLHTHEPITQAPPFSTARKIFNNLVYVTLILCLPIVSFISFIPGIAILFQIDPINETLLFLSMLPLVGASFVLLLTLETILFKWILIGRVKASRYLVHGSFYIRNWTVKKLLKLSLDFAGQLHATLYVSSWYKALGMKIGRMVELSTAITAAPDLVQLDNESTIADEVSLGSPHIEAGWMVLAPVKLGERAFVGNSGVVPAGVEMGRGSLVGVLSIAPDPESAKKTDATWFGSPSLLFPKRERSAAFTESKTYRPSRWLIFCRAAFEVFRVTLPPAGFTIVTVSMIEFALYFWHQLGLVPTILLLPLAFGISSLGIIIVAALAKWLIVGKYKPFVKPLWSNFVWRLELVNALYEFLSAPLLLQNLQGTPFIAWYLRLLGAKIGKHCYIDTTGFLEWDLIEIGDRCAIGEDAIMQTHLFEDRILKAAPFRIEDDCSVGSVSVVLYDTVVKKGCHLDSLSLLMKGEKLPPETDWRGIPALNQKRNKFRKGSRAFLLPQEKSKPLSGGMKRVS